MSVIKVKSSELEGDALNWMVATIEYPDWVEEGYLRDFPEDLEFDDGDGRFEPVTNWSQGGRIIENHIFRLEDDPELGWSAESGTAKAMGDTALIAAMRCYVMTKLGPEVEIDATIAQKMGLAGAPVQGSALEQVSASEDMVEVDVSDVEGAPLNWLVAKIEGAVSDDIDDFCLSVEGEFDYSSEWSVGGNIITREQIGVAPSKEDASIWEASMLAPDWAFKLEGPTPLVAAMRCYVGVKLGLKAYVPVELMPAKPSVGFTM